MSNAVLDSIGGLPALLILALACYRVSRLLASETGPAHIFHRYRQAAIGYDIRLGGLVTCPLCTSVYVAPVLLGLWVVSLAAQVIIIMLAITGAACLMYLYEPR